MYTQLGLQTRSPIMVANDWFFDHAVAVAAADHAWQAAVTAHCPTKTIASVSLSL